MTPTRFPVPFDTFVTPARTKPQLWRLFLGLFLFGIIYIGLTIAITAPAMYFGILDADMSTNTLASMTVLFVTFWAALLGLWAVIRLLHSRKFSTLIGSLPQAKRDFLKAMALFFVLQALWLMTSVITDGALPNQTLISVLIFLPLAAILVFLQTGAEELFFRGYLLQQLAARFQNPLIWFALPPIAFGLLHYEPTVYGGISWGVVIGICLTGLAWADLTRITGNIGAAWGWHFMNNFLLFNFLSLQDDMNGFSWKVSAVGVEDMGRFEVFGDIGFTIVTWLILRRIVRP